MSDNGSDDDQGSQSSSSADENVDEERPVHDGQPEDDRQPEVPEDEDDDEEEEPGLMVPVAAAAAAMAGDDDDDSEEEELESNKRPRVTKTPVQIKDKSKKASRNTRIKQAASHYGRVDNAYVLVVIPSWDDTRQLCRGSTQTTIGKVVADQILDVLNCKYDFFQIHGIPQEVDKTRESFSYLADTMIVPPERIQALQPLVTTEALNNTYTAPSALMVLSLLVKDYLNNQAFTNKKYKRNFATEFFFVQEPVLRNAMMMDYYITSRVLRENFDMVFLGAQESYKGLQPLFPATTLGTPVHAKFLDTSLNYFCYEMRSSANTPLLPPASLGVFLRDKHQVSVAGTECRLPTALVCIPLVNAAGIPIEAENDWKYVFLRSFDRIREHAPGSVTSTLPGLNYIVNPNLVLRRGLVFTATRSGFPMEFYHLKTNITGDETEMRADTIVTLHDFQGNLVDKQPMDFLVQGKLVQYLCQPFSPDAKTKGRSVFVEHGRVDTCKILYHCKYTYDNTGRRVVTSVSSVGNIDGVDCEYQPLLTWCIFVWKALNRSNTNFFTGPLANTVLRFDYYPVNRHLSEAQKLDTNMKYNERLDELRILQGVYAAPMCDLLLRSSDPSDGFLSEVVFESLTKKMVDFMLAPKKETETFLA